MFGAVPTSMCPMILWQEAAGDSIYNAKSWKGKHVWVAKMWVKNPDSFITKEMISSDGGIYWRAHGVTRKLGLWRRRNEQTRRQPRVICVVSKSTCAANALSYIGGANTRIIPKLAPESIPTTGLIVVLSVGADAGTTTQATATLGVTAP